MDKRFEALHQEMNKRFEAIDKRFDLFAESMHRLETTQEKILARLDLNLKEQLTETTAKTDQLEKRLDDLRSMFLWTTRPAEASHQL
jgi:chromosome segregation ATPase